MRLSLSVLLPALLSVLLGPAGLAQTPGTCDIGRTSGVLDASDVEATVFTTGTLFYGPGAEHAYYVPKTTRKSPVYAASLWVAGRVGGEIRAAGTTYGQGRSANDYFEFWPGPLNSDGTLPNEADCSTYDRVWVVSVPDVLAYEERGVATPDLAEWPVGLGAPAVDASGTPIETEDRTRVIDLAAGERPVVYGSQTAFWVMNDVGNEHRTTDSDPLGIEVQVSAFVVTSEDDALAPASFYRYTVVNRNTRPIEDAYVGFFADVDLGNAVDDFVGVDTTRALTYVYNGDGVDEGSRGYGPAPPAFGVDLLDGQSAGGSIPKCCSYFPRTAAEYHNRLRGLLPGGAPIREGGRAGDGATGAVTTYVYPGDPVAGSFWSEEDLGGGQRGVASDRILYAASPAFALGPGEARTFDLALLFAQGADRLDSVTRLREASDRVQALYDAGLLLAPIEIPPPPSEPAALRSPADGAHLTNPRLVFSWRPVAGATSYRLEVSPTEDFRDPLAFSAYGAPSVTAGGFPANQVSPFYWRVVPVNLGGDGPPSDVRRFSYYRYAPGPLLLSDRTPAYVEVQGPGGANPCGASAVSTFGCEEVRGNSVVGSPNGTGLYSLAAGAVDAGVLDGREVEVRWTGGADAYAVFGADTSGARVGRVPFTVWDIGVTRPGQLNDPVDDVQLVPVVARADDACRFAFERTDQGWRTPAFSAAYPVDPVAFAARPADPGPPGCTADALVPVREAARPLTDVVLESEVGALPASALAGAALRFFTADRSPTRLGPTVGGLQVAVLREPFPNPTTGRLTIELTLERPGPAHVSVVDVLGREVVVLASGGDQAAGWRRYTVDTASWAPGVYSVFFRTERGGQSHRFTVAR